MISFRMVRRFDSSSNIVDSFFIAWYDSTRFIAGTSNGHICVLFNGDIQTEMDVIEGRERAVTG